MASIAVYLHYGGYWDDSMKYNGFSICGIMVGAECSFENLVKMVYQQLMKDPAEHSMKLHYQLSDNGPIIPICNDVSLQCYIDLKKGESDRRCYPIFVDVDVVSNNTIWKQNSHTFDAFYGKYRSHEMCDMNSLGYGSGDSDFAMQHPTVEDIGMEFSDHTVVQSVEDDWVEMSYVIERSDVAEIKKGDVFKNKDVLITTLSLIAIRNRFQFRVVRSDTKFYWLKCLEGACNWTIKTSRTGSIGHFKVREFNNKHICCNDSVMSDHRQATSFLIANCVKHNFLSSRRIYTAGDIVEDMQHTYGVHVSYDKAWRARDRALKMIRGDPHESYGNLPAYMHRLEVSNPGSYTRIETDLDDRYLFSFVALGASIAGWKHCKPVIVVDGTFLTGKHSGTLFTACGQDANNNIFILGYGIGDTENNNAWDWFMLRLKEAYGDREGLCIVSDRHGSISHAVDKVFPNALHGACTYHLLKNVRSTFGKKAKGVRIPFNEAVRAYTKADFEIHMRRMDAMDKKIRGYLEEIGFERWSRAHMTNDRYSTMTSNIAESVNSAIKHAKSYPIVSLYESLRCIVQKWFCQNLSDAKSTFTALAGRHDSMLKERIMRSSRLRVYPSSDTIYQVNDETSTNVVDMDEKTCSCGRFQIDHIPCPHAVAVIGKRNYALSEYCSRYFTKEKYIVAYQTCIYPLGNKEDWHVPDEVKNKIVLAPISKRGPGRPKQNRFKSPLEYKKRTRCGNCDAVDHNIRTCPNPMSSHVHNSIKRKKANVRRKRVVEQCDADVADYRKFPSVQDNQ